MRELRRERAEGAVAACAQSGAGPPAYYTGAHIRQRKVGLPASCHLRSELASDLRVAPTRKSPFKGLPPRNMLLIPSVLAALTSSATLREPIPSCVGGSSIVGGQMRTLSLPRSGEGPSGNLRRFGELIFSAAVVTRLSLPRKMNKKAPRRFPRVSKRSSFLFFHRLTCSVTYAKLWQGEFDVRWK